MYPYRVEIRFEATDDKPCPAWCVLQSGLTLERAEEMAANYPAGEDVNRLRVVDMRTGGTSTTWYPPHHQAALADYLKRSSESWEPWASQRKADEEAQATA